MSKIFLKQISLQIINNRPTYNKANSLIVPVSSTIYRVKSTMIGPNLSENNLTAIRGNLFRLILDWSNLI